MVYTYPFVLQKTEYYWLLHRVTTPTYFLFNLVFNPTWRPVVFMDQFVAQKVLNGVLSIAYLDELTDLFICLLEVKNSYQDQFECGNETD